MSLEQLPDPPPPPDAPRHVRFYRYQWAGLFLVAAFPVLALAGVFGETWRVEERSGAALDVTVRYPDRYRYKQLNSLEVWVTNTSRVPVDTVTVAVDTALANRFSTVRALPPFAAPYRTGLADLAPDETRLVLVELQGEQYGRHDGAVEVMGPDTLRVPLSIRIFP